MSNYVRVYQDMECKRSIRGIPGKSAITAFWDELNPAAVIKRDYLKVFNFSTTKQYRRMFPSMQRSKSLIWFEYNEKGKTCKINYSGLIYLIDIYKEEETNRFKINDIYIAEYSDGKLTRISHLVPRVEWFEGRIGFVQIEKIPNDAKMYHCTVYDRNQATNVLFDLEKIVDVYRLEDK